MATIDVALTFTQYKTLDQNGNVVATDDATFYSTVNLNAVEAGTNYTITLNSGNYILALFYDSNGNAVEGDVEVNTPDWSYQAGFSTTFTVPANASYISADGTRFREEPADGRPLLRHHPYACRAVHARA